MTDEMIIDLFWNRSEQAIAETDRKYGAYCLRISFNILQNKEDAEECVSETYLKAWDAIPPERPRHFRAFLGKVVRNISLNLLKMHAAKKRGGDAVKIVSDELYECIPDNSLERELDYRIVLNCINGYLRNQSELRANIFIRRYWYVDTIPAISDRFKMNENTVSSILLRMRKELKELLIKEGVEV